jgi:peptidoglycan hydrolase-like protein with peptidoglycan-binding domain
MFYQRGSKGAEVERIQAKLKELGYYLGAVDGIFGGGTESAVKSYQKDKGLLVDGQVGDKTWRSLFPSEEIPQPEIATKPLGYRSLALTGSFETNAPVPECFAGLSGDFDGQGISFGVLQWNFGQGSLQPLLTEMNERNPDVTKGIFHDRYDILIKVLSAPYTEQMEWIRSIQDPIKHVLFEPWKGLFKTLGRTTEFQNIQTKYANSYYELAKTWCKQYGLWSERAVALMFDIRVQNGGISDLVRATIIRDFDQLEKSGTPFDKNALEVEKMKIIANRRAEATNPQWFEDVRRRKLCCALGEGTVHGEHYDLDVQYGIGLHPFT